MQLTNRSWAFAKVFATNSAASSFASKVPTLTEPTGDGIIDLPVLHDSVDQWVHLVPFGTGADNDTFDFRLIGWKAIDGLWIPVPIFAGTATFGTSVGVSGAAVVNTERFADTITASLGSANVDYILASPANNTIAHVKIATQGFGKLELSVDLTGTSTGANALWVVM